MTGRLETPFLDGWEHYVRLISKYVPVSIIYLDGRGGSELNITHFKD